MLEVNQLIGFGASASDAEYKYWRFLINSATGTGAIVFATLEMRDLPGGADLCYGSGGTPSASINNSDAPNLFDNNIATIWAAGVPAVMAGHWMQYQFTRPVSLAEIYLRVNMFGSIVINATLQRSKDGSLFENVKTFNCPLTSLGIMAYESTIAIP